MTSSAISHPINSSERCSKEEDNESLSLIEDDNAIYDASGKKFKESDAGDGTTTEQQQLKGMKLILCNISCVLCLFLVALDQTIISTILSTIGNEFNSFDQIGWIASLFLLSMASLAAFWGKIAIIYGRKNSMLVSILLFEGGSLMCALSKSMNVMIGGRVLAGVGGGGIQSLVFIIVTELVPINKRPLIMATLGSTFAVLAILGPLIGGAFTTHSTWRWSFYVNLPIGGLLSGLLLLFYNPPPVKGNWRTKLSQVDYVGTVILSAGLVLFFLGLTFADDGYHWSSAIVICFLIFGVLLVAAFFLYTFKWSKNPLIPWEVISIRYVLAAFFTALSSNAYFITTVIYVSIYFQVVQSESAWHTGISLLPLIISIIIASVLGAGLMSGLGYVKPISVFSGVLGPIGCGLLTLLGLNPTSSQRIGLQIVVGVSSGLQTQAATILGQLASNKTYPGGLLLTQSLLNFGRALGGTLGSNLGNVVLTTTYRNKVLAKIAERLDKNMGALNKYNAIAFLSSPENIAKLGDTDQLLVRTCVVDALQNVFFMGLGFAGLTLIASIFTIGDRLPKPKKKKKSVQNEKLAVGSEVLEA